MTEIAERLHIIRDHLRTGALGQREVWEEWLTEAAAEIARLLAALQEIEDFPYVGTQASQKIRGIARRAREPKP
jgi:Trp operon repressor